MSLYRLSGTGYHGAERNARNREEKRMTSRERLTERFLQMPIEDRRYFTQFHDRAPESFLDIPEDPPKEDTPESREEARAAEAAVCYAMLKDAKETERILIAAGVLMGLGLLLRLVAFIMS
jgi:hypothetical protein